VQEARPVLLTVTGANDRSPDVGGEALEGDLLLRGLTGWGETVHVRHARASGLSDLEAGFTFPVNAYDTRIGMRGQIVDSEVVEEPFSLLDVVSRASEAEVSLRHPLYRGVGQELQVALLGQRRSSETELLGRRFSFSEGVQDGRSTVTVLRLVADWLDRSQDQVLALRGTASWGIDALDATENPDGLPDSDFFSLLLQAQYVRRLGLLDASLVARLDGQFSNDRLLRLEKFAVGGIDTVRGYRENTLVRDNGVVGSLELRVPVWQIRLPGIADAPGDGQVELAPFVDAGRSWDNGPAGNPSPTFLASYGIGLRWAPTSYLRGFLYLAERIRDIDDPPVGDRQDSGIHFRFSIDLL
jgi:hemolysin activation/secretion protein